MDDGAQIGSRFLGEMNRELDVARDGKEKASKI